MGSPCASEVAKKINHHSTLEIIYQPPHHRPQLFHDADLVMWIQST